jgi:nucleoside-diphosphate-sugar epimerase
VLKTLITGGAGFLGINLIRYLMHRNITGITSLDIAPLEYPGKPGVKIVRGDVRDKKIVTEAMKGIQLVIHAAAALPLYKKEDIFSTTLEGTGNLLEAAYNEKVNRFIHISSTAVYGIPDHHPIYEDDRLDGVGAYGSAKISAEKLCENYREKGMCIPIVRPKSFIGPERLGVFTLLYDWAKDGKSFPVIGSGKNRYQLLDVEDLCSAIYLCATADRAAANDTFNIGAKNFTTLRDDFQAVLDYAGYGGKIIGFPAWLIIPALKILELLHLSPLYKWVYETVGKDSFVSIEKAEKKLGFTPEYSNKDALIRNYKWYMENLDTFTGETGISHRSPWKHGILRLLKGFF